MKRIWKKIVGTPILTLLGGNAAASALGLLIFALLGRTLSAADFGLWVLFTTATSMTDLMLKGVIKSAYMWAISTVEEYRKERIHGASWLLNFVLSIFLCGLVWALGSVFPKMVADINLQLFFTFYPAYVVLSIPLNFIVWRCQAEKRFLPAQAGRLLVNVVFLATLIYGMFNPFHIEEIAAIYALIHGGIGMIFMMVFRYPLYNIFKVRKSDIQLIWKFGRSSLATLAGGSLLRGTDVYFIGGWLGPEAVAVYSIPMKLMDILDIPLRSIAIAEFSKLAKAWKNEKPKFLTKLYRLLIIGSLLSIAVVGSVIVFSDLILNFFGVEDLQMGTYLLLIFSIAMLAMPVEKFLGIAFDAIGRPDRNALKVWLMLAANILGDFLVLYFFNSIYLVAVVTIVNQLVGIAYSTRFFNISREELAISWQHLTVEWRRKMPFPLNP